MEKASTAWWFMHPKPWLTRHYSTVKTWRPGWLVIVMNFSKKGFSPINNDDCLDSVCVTHLSSMRGSTNRVIWKKKSERYPGDWVGCRQQIEESRSLPTHKEADPSSPLCSVELKAFVCGSSLFFFYLCYLALLQNMCNESDQLICICNNTEESLLLSHFAFLQHYHSHPSIILVWCLWHSNSFIPQSCFSNTSNNLDRSLPNYARSARSLFWTSPMYKVQMKVAAQVKFFKEYGSVWATMY